jgi:hypothetical protein
MRARRPRGPSELCGRARWLSGLAVTYILCTLSCTALVDEELSSKVASGSGSSGGDGGDGGRGGRGGGGSGGSEGGTGGHSSTIGPGECQGLETCDLPHAIGACFAGLCAIVKCDLEFFDCNSNREDGCEINLFHDKHNCGKCSEACSDDDKCEKGECK